MKKRKVEIKFIEEIEHVKCTCGEWCEKTEAISAKHPECYNKYQRDRYRHRKLLENSGHEFRDQRKHCYIDIIEAELSGSLPVSGLYSGLTSEVKQALISGDIKALMTIEVK